MPIKSPKKLIEVALPLDDINVASAREKSIRHGHPSTLHLWWARRPLAAARAVIFAQMVNDPGGERGWYAGKTKAQADAEREELFQIIRDLVKWENTTNEEVLDRARGAIRKSWRETCEMNKGQPGFDPGQLPAFHDPFAGGGSIPLEAQRLGLEAYASDLNPVAVLINKAMIEIPPKFAGQPPVNPESRKDKNLFAREWKVAQGLAEDVRYYGQWMRDEAERRIGHLYPKIEVTAEMAKERPDLRGYIGRKLTVIAWLWARTVKSPNPAFAQVDVPLASTFMLSTKPGKEAYVEPVIENGGYRFTVKVGEPKDTQAAKNGTKVGRGGNFQCLMSSTPIPVATIREQGLAGTFGVRLMAIVAEGDRKRVYLAPTAEHEDAARSARSSWRPEQEINHNPRDIRTHLYGLVTYGDLFTSRQLAALTTLSDLVGEAIERMQRDALAVGLPNDRKRLCDGGSGATAYAEAVGVYLGLAVSRTTNTINALAMWSQSREQSVNLFSRQAIPMAWDFPEVNPFGGAAGDFGATTASVGKTISNALDRPAQVSQADAQTQGLSASRVVSTDPPYYDNVGYADLSDFFYVWLRRSLRPVFPDLFATLAVPKAEELVATPYRHGSKEKAEMFFLGGMMQAMHRLAQQAHPAFPVTIYYAFKQAESDSVDGTASTGWDTFLAAVIEAGFAISGTWPMRTERPSGVKTGTNALASSIVLACRKRDPKARSINRQEFQRELRAELPDALATMIGGTTGQSPIAPVDLAQAAIGPGMAIYSRYAGVLAQDGTRMPVREALILINRVKDEVLGGISQADADTGFCVDWFAQYGWAAGSFGEADTLARAKGTAVAGVVDAGVLESRAGKVRLLRWKEYERDWAPETDHRIPAWQACHQLILALNEGSESVAGALLSRMPEHGESVRALAYHLYNLCEQKKWAEDARVYNELMTAWHGIVAASLDVGHKGSQVQLDLE